MSNSSKITATVAALCALAGTAAAAVYFWPEGDTQKIEQLQQQLIATDTVDLSEMQRERITDQLIREVDQLDRERRRELTENVRAQMRNRIRSGVQQYHVLAEADRAQFLDQELKELARWRGLMFAVHTQEADVPRRFRLSLQDELAEADGTPRPERSSDRRSAARPDRNGSDRAQSDRAQSDRAQSDRAQSDRGQSDRGQSDRGQSDRAQSDRGQSRRSGDDRRGRADAQQAATDNDRRGRDRRLSGRSDRGRRQRWGMGPVEEGMEEQYKAYWEAIGTRYRQRRQASGQSQVSQQSSD